jgi:hypothetical protein
MSVLGMSIAPPLRYVEDGTIGSQAKDCKGMNGYRTGNLLVGILQSSCSPSSYLLCRFSLIFP